MALQVRVCYTLDSKIYVKTKGKMRTRLFKITGILSAAVGVFVILTYSAAFAYIPSKGRSEPSPKSNLPSYAQIKMRDPGSIKLTGIPEHAENRLLVKFKPGVNRKNVYFRSARPLESEPLHPTAISQFKMTQIKKGINGYTVSGKSYKSLKDIPDEKVIEAMPAYKRDLCYWEKAIFAKGIDLNNARIKLENDPGVDRVEFDYIVRPQSAPNDPRYGQQTNLHNMDYSLARNIAPGPNEVVIAIVDTGVDYNHEDLTTNIWHHPSDANDEDQDGRVGEVNGWDFYNGDADPKDDFGHGTHCSGIAAAVTDNSTGIAGVSPTAKIMAVKFMSQYGFGYISDAAQAIEYAASHGAKVISNSWGGGAFSEELQDAITYAYNMGCFVVVAAGNSNVNAELSLPANYRHVFVVGAIDDSNNTKAPFSNFGSKVDVAAPGVGILSTMPQYPEFTLHDPNYGGYSMNYAKMSGTSMACPHVAGEAALILSKYSHAPDRVANIIRAGALPDISSDDYIGTGRINLYQSLLNNTNLPDSTVARITGPAYEILLGPASIPISGRSIGYKYTLSYATTPYAANWTRFAQSIGNVQDGVLGYLNTPGMPGGKYFIKLTTTANYWSPAQTNVTKIVFDDKIMSGWPQQMEGYPYPDVLMSPVCADFDNDGNKELLAFSYQNYNELSNDDPGHPRLGARLYLWHSDGTRVPGWEQPKPVLGSTSRIFGIPSDGLFYTTPAVADLDGDKDLEFVFAINESGQVVIHAWHHNGASMSGWPKVLAFESNGIPNNVAIGDINGDGQPEIFVSMFWYDYRAPEYRTAQVYGFDKSGNVLTGWPATYNDNYVLVLLDENFAQAQSDITLADIDNDGHKDVIFAYSKDYDCVVNILDGRGQALTGWPKTINMGTSQNNAPVGIAVGDANLDGNKELFFATLSGQIYSLDKDGNILFSQNTIYSTCSSLSLADLDNDSDLEIIVQDMGRFTFVFNHYGTCLPGWPKQAGDTSWLRFGYPVFASAPIIGDIDGDGDPDILQGSNGESKLFAFDAVGNMKPGFPRFVSADMKRMYGTPSLVDFDNDGKVEVISGDGSGRVLVWKFGDYNPLKVPWPVLGQNLARTYSHPCAPNIKSLTPVSGVPNSVVIIRGSGFGSKQESGVVRFGETQAFINDWNGMAISCMVPDMLMGTYPVTVKTQFGTSKGVNFEVPATTVPLMPVIYTLDPESGKAHTVLAIEGKNFGPVKGNGKVTLYRNKVNHAVRVIYWTDKLIYCYVPQILPNEYEVRVYINPKTYSAGKTFTVTK